LFNSVKGRFGNLTIGDENGDVTNVPTEARFFDFDFGPQQKPIGKVSISLDEENGIAIIYNKDMIDENYGQHKQDWFSFLKDMRMFSKKRLLKFEVRDITRTNLQKRDYKFLATNRPGDNTMSESKMYGTHKTSFQKFGSAKLSIKHNGTIDEGESRNKKIGSIFIENSDGEKFKYPFKHLSGARAMAKHIGEGGHPFDDFGKHISGLSEELSKLRKFNQYMNRSSVMAETLSEYTGTVKERMGAIKKEISNLQKSAYYAEALDNFTPAEVNEVPSEVAENWIDQLTVKQFNEELKDVFPYIYNLVSESTLAEAVNAEDLLGEAQDTYHKVAPGETIFSIAQQYIDHFPGGVQQGVDEIMNANGISNPKMIQVGTELVIPLVAKDIGASPTTPGATRGVDPKDNYSKDDLKRLTNPSMEQAFESAVEDLMGQFAEGSLDALIPAAKELAKGRRLEKEWKQFGAGVEQEASMAAYLINIIKQKQEAGENIPADAAKNAIEKFKYLIGPGSSAVKFYKAGFMSDETNQRIKSAAEHLGVNLDEGNKFGKAVRMAKFKGAKKGDEIDGPDGKKITIEKDQKTPLGEFILSYFDRHSGQFPKGETAVLTMVEKEYGEQYIRPAQAFIEQINNKVAEVMGYRETETDESALMGHIGKKKYGKDGMAALSKAGREGASEEELGRIKDKYKKESQDILKLAGLN
jgi:LysM repeat protein